MMTAKDLLTLLRKMPGVYIDYENADIDSLNTTVLAEVEIEGTLDLERLAREINAAVGA